MRSNLRKLGEHLHEDLHIEYELRSSVYIYVIVSPHLVEGRTWIMLWLKVMTYSSTLWLVLEQKR
jgi:hypothetical protein